MAIFEVYFSFTEDIYYFECIEDVEHHVALFFSRLIGIDVVAVIVDWVQLFLAWEVDCEEHCCLLVFVLLFHFLYLLVCHFVVSKAPHEDREGKPTVFIIHALYQIHLITIKQSYNVNWSGSFRFIS